LNDASFDVEIVVNVVPPNRLESFRKTVDFCDARIELKLEMKIS